VIETINVKKDKMLKIRKAKAQKLDEVEKADEMDDDEFENMDGELIRLSYRDHTLSPIIK